MMALCFEVGGPFENNRMTTMMPVMTGKAVSEKLNSMQFKIRLRPTIDETVSSPW